MSEPAADPLSEGLLRRFLCGQNAITRLSQSQGGNGHLILMIQSQQPKAETGRNDQC
jgi:hypothetical protein